MGMSITLREYLDNQGVEYDLVRHPRTVTSMETAAAAHIAGDKLAKSVMVQDEHGYMTVVIPSTHHVQFGELRAEFGHSFGLATEEEIDELFDDCELGAVPALGQAYGLMVLVDETLLEQDEVYFEAGDHTELVHLSGRDFEALMAHAGHGHFSRHV
jgi:Ala-tRNA(Pro) deacylase